MSASDQAMQKAHEYRLKGDVVAAIKAYGRVLAALDEATEPLEAANVLILTASCYIYTTDHKAPLEALKKAQELLHKQARPDMEGILLREKGRVLSADGKVMLGYEALSNSLKLLDDKFPDERRTTQLALAHCNLICGDYLDAKEILQAVDLERAEIAEADKLLEIALEQCFYGLITQSWAVLESNSQKCFDLALQLDYQKSTHTVLWAQIMSFGAHSYSHTNKQQRAKEAALEARELLQGIPPLVAEKIRAELSWNVLTRLVASSR